MNTRNKDMRYLGRDGTVPPIEITGSKGNFLFSGNKKYIDFLMGWNVGNAGWNATSVTKKSIPNYVYPPYMYKSWAELAELLAKITPGNLAKSFRATGGTEAVEIALQAAMVHTKRSGFASIEGSYHGHSIAAMSVGSSSYRKHWKLLPDCYKINAPLDENAGRKVEKILKSETTAAFIAEPIVCNIGVVIPDKEFFDIVSDACKEYGTLLIMDEVATGFGRTGKLFASEHYGIKPDIMTLGKAISGGNGAIGATVMTNEVAKSMNFSFSNYSTFGWLPMATEATLENIKYILKNKLWSKAAKMGEHFEDRLNDFNFKSPTEIRVKGLAIGLEFEKKNYSYSINQRAMKKGLLTADIDANNLGLFPALNIDLKTADRGLDILSKSL